MEVIVHVLKQFLGKKLEGIAKDSSDHCWNQNVIWDLYKAMARQALTF
ncbi:hypothetical protein SAMN03080594_101657 [Arenibacter palladensis]|uniref:Uncharacterized protein n=1 Tax=Arenibacter palladensis TaxID=237373 RepID=A0A1M4UKC5_9FLAO|nr:hypothetical protein [Arenibacter palladensis]SHE57124.1 hypothetical protein SAMN03080594_101657 [Arenibacter palladensis]